MNNKFVLVRWYFLPLIIIPLLFSSACAHVSSEIAAKDPDSLDEWVVEGELELDYIGSKKKYPPVNTLLAADNRVLCSVEVGQ